MKQRIRQTGFKFKNVFEIICIQLKKLNLKNVTNVNENVFQHRNIKWMLSKKVLPLKREGAEKTRLINIIKDFWDECAKPLKGFGKKENICFLNVFIPGFLHCFLSNLNYFIDTN